MEFLRTLEDGIRLVPDLDKLERVEQFKVRRDGSVSLYFCSISPHGPGLYVYAQYSLLVGFYHYLVCEIYMCCNCTSVFAQIPFGQVQKKESKENNCILIDFKACVNTTEESAFL